MSVGLFHVYSGISIVPVLVQLMLRQLCWWDFMDIVFYVIKRYGLPENSMIFFLALILFWSTLMQLFTGVASKALHFDWLRSFVVISSFWKEKFPQWGMKTTCICGYKKKYLGCCQRLCWISKVVVINNISLMEFNTYWARELPCLVLVPRLLLCTSEVIDMRKVILFSSVSRGFF